MQETNTEYWRCVCATPAREVRIRRWHPGSDLEQKKGSDRTGSRKAPPFLLETEASPHWTGDPQGPQRSPPNLSTPASQPAARRRLASLQAPLPDPERLSSRWPVSCFPRVWLFFNLFLFFFASLLLPAVISRVQLDFPLLYLDATV